MRAGTWNFPSPSLNSDPPALAHLSRYFAICVCPLLSGPDSFASLLRSAETIVWKDQASDLPPEDKHSSPLNVLLLEALGTVYSASHPSTWCRTHLVELPAQQSQHPGRPGLSEHVAQLFLPFCPAVTV